MIDEGVGVAFVHPHVAPEHHHDVRGADGIRGFDIGHIDGLDVADLIPVCLEHGREAAEVGNVEVSDDDGDSAGGDGHGQSSALITMASVVGLPELGGT